MGALLGLLISKVGTIRQPSGVSVRFWLCVALGIAVLGTGMWLSSGAVVSTGPSSIYYFSYNRFVYIYDSFVFISFGIAWLPVISLDRIRRNHSKPDYASIRQEVCALKFVTVCCFQCHDLKSVLLQFCAHVPAGSLNSARQRWKRVLLLLIFQCLRLLELGLSNLLFRCHRCLRSGSILVARVWNRRPLPLWLGLSSLLFRLDEGRID